MPQAKIKNYTSSVAPGRTIAEIERLLAEAGALHIGKVYMRGTGVVSGFLFTLPIQNVPVQFKLPVKTETVEKLFTQDMKTYGEGYAKRAAQAREQAHRTAWRLMLNWIEVQLAMIKLGQADALEVFMPYAYNAHTAKTLFEEHGEDMLLALPAPNGDGTR